MPHPSHHPCRRWFMLGLIVALALSALGPGGRPAQAAADGPWAWGGNWSGQFGDGTTTNSSIPVLLAHAGQVVAFGAGAGHTAVLRGDGTVWAWGYDRNSELANPSSDTCVGGGDTRPCSKVPLQVPGIANGVKLTAGAYHTLVQRSDGTLWAWGFNGYGQLGSTTGEICSAGVACSSTPVEVPGMTNLASFAGGHLHNLALKQDRTVWAWGANYLRQLGAPTTQTCQFGLACSSTPLQVPGLPPITVIAAGSVDLADHSLVLAQDGTVWAWGRNDSGQLGVSTTATCDFGIACSPSPVMVAALSSGAPVTALAVGTAHSLALRSDGTVWAWGDNSQGELGDGTFTSRNTPAPVAGFSGAVGIAAGSNFSVALKADGTVWAWGRNTDGMLGDGTTTTRSVPVQVVGLSGITHLAVGDAHVLAIGPVDDSTQPVIMPVVTGTAGSNGWYTSAVLISWNISDPESPIDHTSGCDPSTITTDTAGITLTCTATSAGGTASKSITIKRDATPPSLSPSVSPNPVYLNGTATVTGAATDNLSGIATQSCGVLATDSVGQKSVSCTATDRAGNTNSTMATYRVIYRFNGFLQPINDTVRSQICGAPCPVSIFKGGNTVPVKFQLKDANGVVVQSAMPPTWLTPAQGSPISAAIDESVFTDTSFGGTAYSWDGEQYRYNWKTKGFAIGFYWRIGVALDDGQTYHVYVGLR